MYIALATAGGGGYAAALLFYFLQYMDTIKINYQQTILDKLSMMSVVSGSAVTGMDYALRGRDMFDDFEEKFLKVNVRDQLRVNVFGGLPRTLPSLLRFLFTRSESTRLLSQFFEDYYSQALYEDVRQDSPQVVVNMSCPEVDRSLYFTDEYFSMFGHNLSEFSVGEAVGIATSFIPLVFGSAFESGSQENRQLGLDYLNRFDTEEVKINFPDFWEKIQQLKSLAKNNEDYFLHLRDAAFSDGTGLSYILEQLLPGGKMYEGIVQKKIKKLVVFQIYPVNFVPDNSIDRSEKVPNFVYSLAPQVINSMSSFIIRYVQFLLRSYEEQYDFQSYFIELNPFILEKNFLRELSVTIPEGFGLSEENLALIERAVPLLLEANEVYQEFLSDISLDLTVK